MVVVDDHSERLPPSFRSMRDSGSRMGFFERVYRTPLNLVNKTHGFQQLSAPGLMWGKDATPFRVSDWIPEVARLG